MENKFSVLLCFYGKDNPTALEEALDSIQRQTLLPDQLVLLQDGPVSLELESVVERFVTKHDYAELVQLECNQGHGIARKKGLEVCVNRFVAICDADDISRSDRFQKQIAMFNANNGLSVVSSDLREFSGEVNNILGYKRLPFSDFDLKQLIKWKCPINQPSVMFNKDHVESVGGYIDWHHNEDYYLWIRMAKAGFLFSNIQEDLLYFRVDNSVYARRGGYAYFKSELAIQKLLLKEGYASFYSFSLSVVVRFIVQVLFPNKLRKIFYNTLMRS